MKIVLGKDEMGYLVWPEGELHQRGLAPEERRTSSPVSPHIWGGKVCYIGISDPERIVPQYIFTGLPSHLTKKVIKLTSGGISWVTGHSLGYQTPGH